MKWSSERLYIRTLQPEDAEALVELMIRNRAVWETVEPERSDSYYTANVQRQNLVAAEYAAELGQGFVFGIYLQDGDRLIGEASLYEVRRGPFQSAYLGYSIDGERTGNGYATEAVRLLLRFVFAELKLNRIAAGVMPRNTRSIRVLEKLGFQREGLSRQNLRINGAWEDHLQYGLLRDEWLLQSQPG